MKLLKQTTRIQDTGKNTEFFLKGTLLWFQKFQPNIMIFLTRNERRRTDDTISQDLQFHQTPL